MNDNASSFTYRKGDAEFTAPAPSQSAWDIILAVLAGAAIALAGCYSGQSFQNHDQGDSE